jgi:hypothetical protein
MLGAIALSAGSAAAATPVTKSLPITSFRQIVADSAHGHLFLSEGSDDYSTAGGTGSILVTGLSGNTVTTITGLAGVKGLALSPDGSTLYAAVAGSSEIAVISTSTLAVTGTYPLGSGHTPYNLAFEDGLLWVSYGAPDSFTSGTSGIGYIDPASANPTLVPSVLNNTWLYPPYIAADPDNASAASTTGTVVAVSPGLAPVPTASFKISGATMTSSNSANLSTPNPLHGLNVLPGGSQFVLDGSTYETTDVSAGVSAYAVPEGGDTASAVAPNGMVAIGYGTRTAADAGVVTFPSGSTAADPANGYSGFGDTASYVAGMAWSADSSELFSVVTNDDSSGNVTGYTLQTLYPPNPIPPAPSSLLLATSAATVGYDGKVTATATLGASDTQRTVSIYGTPVGGKQKLLASSPLSANGTLAVTLPLTTTTTFTASVAGDDKYAAATSAAKTVKAYASVQESISGYYGSTKISGYVYRDYHRTATFRDAVNVAPGKPGECVKFEFQYWNGKAWVSAGTTGCGYLSKSSSLTYNRSISGYRVGGHYRVRVDFVPSSSDTANLAADSGWILFIVQK